ncbi:hypothetical protein PS914_04550 [Pseudomonas fluorescens]|nr:hypothetical protein PS914_04550 [Pseudomonas fluorescens]
MKTRFGGFFPPVGLEKSSSVARIAIAPHPIPDRPFCPVPVLKIRR